jgi:hypothetical protein
VKISDLPLSYQQQALAQLGQLPPPEPHVKRVVPPSDDLNKTEKAWLSILEARGYKDIHCQDINLRVGALKCFYRPDFFVGDINTFFETKGTFIRDDGLVKIKAAALQYPMFRWVLAQKEKGEWIEKVIHDPTT